jgi:hypothetical protein
MIRLLPAQGTIIPRMFAGQACYIRWYQKCIYYACTKQYVIRCKEILTPAI